MIWKHNNPACCLAGLSCCGKNVSIRPKATNVCKRILHGPVAHFKAFFQAAPKKQAQSSEWTPSDSEPIRTTGDQAARFLAASEADVRTLDAKAALGMHHKADVGRAALPPRNAFPSGSNGPMVQQKLLRCARLCRFFLPRARARARVFLFKGA